MQTEQPTNKNETQRSWEIKDFRIISESWDKHRISDGSVLRARVFLTGVMLETSIVEIESKLRAGEKPRIGLNFRTKNIIEVEAPPELRGKPDMKQMSNAEMKDSIIQKDMPFTTIQQAWNVYEIEGGIILKLRMSPVSIRKTNKFEDRGMPIYNVESSIELSADVLEYLKAFKEKIKQEKESPTFKPVS
jgi:hypothetical protein